MDTTTHPPPHCGPCGSKSHRRLVLTVFWPVAILSRGGGVSLLPWEFSFKHADFAMPQTRPSGGVQQRDRPYRHSCSLDRRPPRPLLCGYHRCPHPLPVPKQEALPRAAAPALHPVAVPRAEGRGWMGPRPPGPDSRGPESRQWGHRRNWGPGSRRGRAPCSAGVLQAPGLSIRTSLQLQSNTPRMVLPFITRP